MLTLHAYDPETRDEFAAADLEEGAFEAPVATFLNGCIRLGRLPIGDDQARTIRDHMARPEARRNIGPLADRYVRDLDAALKASAAERAERAALYHKEPEDVHA